MSDVMEQGGPERPPLPPWVRLLALAALAAAAVVWLSNGLLSADAPERSAPPPSTPPGTTPPSRPAPDDGPAARDDVVLVTDGDRLVRYDAFGVSPGAVLPPGAPEGGMTIVDGPGSEAVLLAPAGGRLYRFAPRSAEMTDVAAGHAVVDAATGAGLAFVQVDDSDRPVVTMDTSSGAVVDPMPFGERPAGYEPVGALSLFGVEGLLQRRVGPPRGGGDLAVAWAADVVAAGRRPAFQPLPGPGRLLGLTDEWVLLLRGRCPGPDCRLFVVGFARAQPSVRQVLPPEGWSFSPYEAGVLRGPLLPVVPLGPAAGSAPALARLVAGGDRALLVPSTEGLVPEAGVVEQPDGHVVFVRVGPEGIRRAHRWDADRPGEVVTVPSVAPLPRTAQLVCVCR